VNLKELKEIFRLVEKTDFTEVEVVRGDFRIRIERGKISGTNSEPITTSLVHPNVHVGTHKAPAMSPSSEELTIQEGKPVSKAETESGQFVTSPFVGTFYRAPSPDVDPYVQVGQVIKKGQVLCIIEAMKLMNEIESDFDGKLVEIYSENGQPVEFGEKLFKIEPI